MRVTANKNGSIVAIFVLIGIMFHLGESRIASSIESLAEKQADSNSIPFESELLQIDTDPASLEEELEQLDLKLRDVLTKKEYVLLSALIKPSSEVSKRSNGIKRPFNPQTSKI